VVPCMSPFVVTRGDSQTFPQERNIFYVVQIEVFLAKFFNTVPVEDDEDLLCVVVPCYIVGFVFVITLNSMKPQGV
jgi:hypothetical protein